MEWMAWMQWLIPLLCTVLAGGGIWTLLAARSTSRATEAAAAAAAQPQLQQANTADWTSLMAYWQSEMSALRSDGAKLEARILFLESQREDDLNHISDLTQHIWQQLPPPPPPRRATPPKQ